MTPDERYNHDVQFRHLVDSLYVQIREARYTPTEIREAAMLAQIHYENLHPRTRWVYDPASPTNFSGYDPINQG